METSQIYTTNIIQIYNPAVFRRLPFKFKLILGFHGTKFAGVN